MREIMISTRRIGNEFRDSLAQARHQLAVEFEFEFEFEAAAVIHARRGVGMAFAPRPVMKTPLFASIALALALPAMAQQAVTTDWVNLRAGPGRDYPLVARLRPDTPIQVEGCLSGYQWCDVSIGPDRGWIYAERLSYVYQDRPVPILGWGARIGLPIIGFSIGSYWDDYYRQRPWYGQRPRWDHRPPPGPPHHRPPPRPSPRPPPHATMPPPGHAQPPAPPHRPPHGQPPARPPQGQHPVRPPGAPEGRPPGHGGGRPPGGDHGAPDKHTR